MQTPRHVVFHDLERSQRVEDALRRHAEELERHFDRVTRCRVVVAAPSHRSGNRGRAAQGDRDRSRARRDEKHPPDVYVAINDAFKAAKRQLGDYAQKLRGEVKRHEPWGAETIDIVFTGTWERERA